MLIYQSNPETGEYVGSREARQDPMEPGRYLIPRGAVTEAPPETGANEAAVLVDGTWQVVSDFRGVTYWTAEGEEVTIQALGETKPADALDTPPLEPEQPITRVSKARIALFLYRRDTANGTALKATMEQIIASDPEAQILYDSVVDLELDRGGTRTIWDAVRAQTGTDLTVEDVFEGAAALTI